MLRLVPDPENEYDKCAIGVYRDRVGQIGFIGNHLSEEVADHLEDGGHAYATVIEITGGTSEKPTRGVNIEVILCQTATEPRKVKRPVKPKKPSKPIMKPSEPNAAEALAGCMVIMLVLALLYMWAY